MIEVHFFDYGCGVLDVEKELGIAEDVDVWLYRMVPGIRLEATDSRNDMDDNAVYWFSVAKEKTCCERIRTILRSRSLEQSKMRYTVKGESELARNRSCAMKDGLADG